MTTRLELLVDDLDRNFARRKRELADIKIMAVRAAGSRGEMLRRSGHVMAYAHWEGFVKLVFGGYLRYLCDSKYFVSILKNELRALSAMSAIGAESSIDFAKTLRLLEIVNDTSEVVFSVNPGKMIQTGNLNSKKLKSLISMCSLEYLDEYVTRQNFIDEVLCGRRHKIAHGELVLIERMDLEQTIDGVLHLCESINDQVIETILESRYLADSR